MLKEEIDVIIELMVHSKTEEANQRIQLLAPQVSSEYGKGALLALGGILRMKSKGEGKELDVDKMLRSSERIVKNQTTDDLDKGYLQTLTKWVRRVKAPKPA